VGKIKTPPKKKEPQHPEQEEFRGTAKGHVVRLVHACFIVFPYTEVASLYKAGRRECVLIMSSNLGYYLHRLNDNDYHSKRSNCFATIHKLRE